MASARHFTGDKLAIASHNAGKVREIADLIRPLGVSVVSASELDLAEPVEDGTTFQANAIIKAKTATMASGLPALADDSGLAITALGGAPGIYSARWAGADKDFNAAMAKVEQELGGATDRSAAFICALTLAWPDGHTETFEGRIEGVLVWPPRGSRGFGYDPVFQAEGRDITFGEMDPVEKHSISHRAKAFAGLVAACFGSS
jgi:XTP/dITP diphosphohydrolase|tara:strand:- start:476 stop:1084 length:609 start_codon:yes stop_codon:yes gene_type:complete